MFGQDQGVPDIMSVDQARELVLASVKPLPAQEVDLLDAVGRVAAYDHTSDTDVAPFETSARDGYAVRSADLRLASAAAPVELDVTAEIPAGSSYSGVIGEGQCARIMCGATMPEGTDATVMYEYVQATRLDGTKGGRVAFTKPVEPGDKVRHAGNEARSGEVIVHAGDVVSPLAVGFMADCGILRCAVHSRPRVALLPTGSELVNANDKPTPGKIRATNGHLLAALSRRAGADVDVYAPVPDDYDVLCSQVVHAACEHDVVVTTGGAAGGDYDFIKRVLMNSGELLVARVRMAPGPAQSFGLVEGTPVFGLPGMPAAVMVGYSLLVRPALRRLAGHVDVGFVRVRARITRSERLGSYPTPRIWRNS